MQSWNSSLLFIEFVTLKMELSIHRQSFRNSIPPLKNVRKRGAAPLDCCAWTMYGKMYTHSALIFKKAKLQEARGQIGWTGAVGKSTEERCSRMHLCTCNRASNRGGWLAGWLAPDLVKRRRNARLPGAVRERGRGFLWWAVLRPLFDPTWNCDKRHRPTDLTSYDGARAREERPCCARPGDRLQLYSACLGASFFWKIFRKYVGYVGFGRLIRGNEFGIN